MLCECKQAKEYWDAIGNKGQYFTRRFVKETILITAIPIIGQIIGIFLLFWAPFWARDEGRQGRVQKQYRLDYIRELVDKDMNKRKRK